MIAGLVQNGDCEFVALVERRIDRKPGRGAHYSFPFSLRPQTLVDSVNLMPHQPLASRSPRPVNPSSPRSCRSVPSLVPSRCRPSRPASVSRSRICSGQYTVLKMVGNTARTLTVDMYHFRFLFAAASCGVDSLFIFMVGLAVETSAMTTWEQAMIGRLITGYGVGALSLLAPLYQAECSPKHLRGLITGTYQLMATVGM